MHFPVGELRESPHWVNTEINQDRQTKLHKSTLSDLPDISVEGPELSNFSPDRAIAIWWKDYAITRRVNQSARKEYRPRQSASEASATSSSSIPEEEEGEELALNDWNKWFKNDDKSDDSQPEESDLETLD